jgi:hypothetical protein
MEGHSEEWYFHNLQRGFIFCSPESANRSSPKILSQSAKPAPMAPTLFFDGTEKSLNRDMAASVIRDTDVAL